MAYFVLRITENKQFNFSLKNSEGKTLLKSEQYQSKASAENGINSITQNATEDVRYELKTTESGKFYFNLKARNGQVVGTSVFYATEAERQHAIDTVKKETASATLKDETY